MLTMSDARRGNFKFLNRQSPEKRVRNLESLKYIEYIASRTGACIDHWDVKALFGSGSGNDFVQDRGEINRRFFEEFERRKSAGPVYAPEIREQVMRLALERGSTERRRIQQELNARRERYDAHLNNLSSIRGEIIRLMERENQVISAPDTKFSEEIGKIIESGVWTFHGVYDRRAFLITSNDVIQTYKNPAASVDISYNFGRFMMSIDSTNLNIEVYPFERNSLIGNVYHPFIGRSGSPCLGGGERAYHEALRNGELFNAVQLLNSILHTFQEGAFPYLSIADFANVPFGDKKREIAKLVENQTLLSRFSFAYVNYLQEKFGPGVFNSDEDEEEPTEGE